MNQSFRKMGNEPFPFFGINLPPIGNSDEILQHRLILVVHEFGEPYARSPKMGRVVPGFKDVVEEFEQIPERQCLQLFPDQGDGGRAIRQVHAHFEPPCSSLRVTVIDFAALAAETRASVKERALISALTIFALSVFSRRLIA